MRKRNFLFSLIVLAMTYMSVQAQSVYYVDAGVATSGAGDSWVAAYKTLEEAVAQTTKSSTDIIFVKKGTYTAPSTDGLGYFFDERNVTVYGNCDGTESMSNLPEVDMDTDLATLLKAPLEGEETLGRVITIYKGVVTFIGFDIEGGNAAKAVNKLYGSGLQGGAVWIQGKGTLQYCKIHGARAITGGGVYLKSQSDTEPAILEYCEIYDNESTGTTAASQGGGGVHLSAAYVFVKNCIIRNNTSATYGGGLFGNDAPSPATSLISSCIIKDNNGLRSGAVNIARGTIVNCLVTGNVGANSVGAIQIGATAVIVNSTVVNNKVANGAGAGGISIGGGLVKNCIVWGNTINNGAINMDLRLASHNTNAANVSTVVNSCFATSSGSTSSHVYQPVLTNNIESDPSFTGASDFTLQASSPCKNTGDNAAYDLASYSDKDLNGKSRIMYGTIDMGAYEIDNSTTEKPVLSSDVIEIYSPAKNVLSVKHEGNIAIYDVSGKLQISKTIFEPTDFSLSSGMYIVSIAGQVYKAIVQ